MRLLAVLLCCCSACQCGGPGDPLDAGVDSGVADSGAADSGADAGADAGLPVPACNSRDAGGVLTSQTSAPLAAAGNRRLARVAGVTAWFDQDVPTKITVRVDGAADFEQQLTSPALMLDLAVRGNTIAVAWADVTGVRVISLDGSFAAVHLPITELRRLRLVALSDGFAVVFTAGGVPVLSWARVGGGAMVVLDDGTSALSVGLDAVATPRGLAVGWGQRVFFLGADGGVEAQGAFPVFGVYGSTTLSWNGDAGVLAALLSYDSVRRPEPQLFVLDDDGGGHLLWQSQRTAYFTEQNRNSFALAPCADGFAVAWRDDSDHPRGAEQCQDSEYCLTNDLRGGYVRPDGGSVEWRLAFGPRHRVVSPVLAPRGSTLDVGWIEQDLESANGGPQRRVLYQRMLDCECLRAR